jgi:hypothetical protein
MSAIMRAPFLNLRAVSFSAWKASLKEITEQRGRHLPRRNLRSIGRVFGIQMLEKLAILLINEVMT